MDEPLARRRATDARSGRLATVDAAGQPHLVPCCFVLEHDVLYTAVDDKPKRSSDLRRVRNITANPAVSLLVDHYEEDWTQLWWVRLDGRGRIVEDLAEMDGARADLMAKYPQYRQLEIPGPVIAVDILRCTGWP